MFKFEIIKAVFCFCLGIFVLDAQTPAKAGQKRALVAVPLISQLVKKSAPGIWKGALIDVLHKVEAKSGIPFDLKVVPFKRAIMMTKEGASDFGVFLESPERNQIAMPILKLGEAIYVAVSMKSKKITSLDQLSGKILGKIRGGGTLKSLSALPDVNYHLFSTHDEGVRLLKRGRIDVLITADFRVLEAIDRLDLSYDDIAKPVPIEGRGLWLYWSWKSDLIFDSVRQIKQGPAVTIEGFGPTELYDIYNRRLHNKLKTKE